mgnify:CR=1 FL=1
MATTKKPMSEGTKKILAYLKECGVGNKQTTKSVQAALGLEKPNSVVGAVTSLVNKKLVERLPEVVEDEDGKTKEIKYFALTQAGAEFDPDAVVEDAE